MALFHDKSPRKYGTRLRSNLWMPASAILVTCYALVENVPLLLLHNVLLPRESLGNHFRYWLPSMCHLYLVEKCLALASAQPYYMEVKLGHHKPRIYRGFVERIEPGTAGSAVSNHMTKSP